MGANQDKTNIKKNGITIVLDAGKEKNVSMMFYLKAKRYAPEGSKPQEENINITEDKNPNDDKKERQKNLDLPSEMDINVVYRY